MNLINGNLVKSVMQFGKDALGVDLEEADVSAVIRQLSFSENIRLANALKNDNIEMFSELLDIQPEEEVTEDGYGTVGTQSTSASSIKSQGSQDVVAQRRANNSQQDANRDAATPARTVAGANKQATGTGADRSDPNQVDPDDIQAQQNAQTAGFAAQQAQQNAAEIERLKQLAMGRR